MNEGTKATSGVLRYLPARLRSAPLLAAITVGWLTLVAWFLATYNGPTPLQGDAGIILLVLIIPLLFLGYEVVELIGRLMGHPAAPPDSGNSLGLVLIFFVSLVLNMLVVWGGLKLLGWGLRFRRRPANREIDHSPPNP